ncbi:MAG: helicase, partial [Lachnospiraceae bacterium]|nr:helicase [Lachnospiraceae bacterium]
MNEFDNIILTVSDNICKNIANLQDDERGFLSQNILNNLRNLVEAIDQRIYSDIEPIVANNYYDIQKSVKYVASRGNLRFLSKFHDYLQISVSHYTPDEDSSIRLMIKYYEWMLRIREYVKKVFNLDILYNLEDYPLDQDESMQEYYEKIASLLDNTQFTDRKPNNRFYIQKCKPFFVCGKVYYEIIVTSADDYSSKFNRFTVFSNKEIPNYYAIKLNFIEGYINILNRKMPIRIVNSVKVAIRPVELRKIATIIGVRPVSAGSNEYFSMMDYLTETGMSLTEIVDLDNAYYDLIKRKVSADSKSNNFFTLLDMCREFTKTKKTGYNTVRYLLYRLRNKILSQQMSNQANNWISYLYLQNGCLPFENMPYATSLLKHNPPLLDLFACISSDGREHELLARKVIINTEQKVQLFTPLSDVQSFGDLDLLVKKYNCLLPNKHKLSRSLVIDGDKIYVKGYVTDTVDILKNLSNRVGEGLRGYGSSITTWIENNRSVDCKEKENILKRIFDSHDLALIYGAAGTGKTTLIKHIAAYFSNAKKLFLANTHPAKEHLRRQIKIANSEFSTIASSKSIVRKEKFD